MLLYPDLYGAPTPWSVLSVCVEHDVEGHFPLRSPGEWRIPGGARHFPKNAFEDEVKLGAVLEISAYLGDSRTFFLSGDRVA